MDNSHFNQYPNMHPGYMQQPGSVDSSRSQYGMQPPMNYPPYPSSNPSSMSQASASASSYFNNVPPQQSYSSCQQMYNMPPNGYSENSPYETTWNTAYPQSENYNTSTNINDPNYIRQDWNITPQSGYDSTQQWSRSDPYAANSINKDSYPIDYGLMTAQNYYPTANKQYNPQYGNYPSTHYPQQPAPSPNLNQPYSDSYRSQISADQPNKSQQPILHQQRPPTDFPVPQAQQHVPPRHPQPQKPAMDYHSSPKISQQQSHNTIQQHLGQIPKIEHHQNPTHGKPAFSIPQPKPQVSYPKKVENGTSEAQFVLPTHLKHSTITVNDKSKPCLDNIQPKEIDVIRMQESKPKIEIPVSPVGSNSNEFSEPIKSFSPGPLKSEPPLQKPAISPPVTHTKWPLKEDISEVVPEVKLVFIPEPKSTESMTSPVSQPAEILSTIPVENSISSGYHTSPLVINPPTLQPEMSLISPSDSVTFQNDSSEKPKQKRQYTKRKKQNDDKNEAPNLLELSIDTPSRKKTGRKSGSKVCDSLSLVDTTPGPFDVYNMDIGEEGNSIEPPHLIPQAETTIDSISPDSQGKKRGPAPGQKRRASGAPKGESTGKRGRKSAILSEEVNEELEIPITNGKDSKESLPSIDIICESAAPTLKPQVSPNKVTTTRCIKTTKSSRKPLPTLIKRKKKKTKEVDEEDVFEDPEYVNRAMLPKDDRRSSRTAGAKIKYNIDDAFGLSDDDDGVNEDEVLATFQPGSAFVEDDIKVVEKILGRRIGKRVMEQRTETEITVTEEQLKAEREAALKPGEDEIEVPTTPSEIQNPDNYIMETDKTPIKNQVDAINKPIVRTVVDIQEIEEDVEEFFIKYKGLSYLHCEWKTYDEILDSKFPAKLKRFMQKHFHEDLDDVDDTDLFNPDYVEVERVLDVRVYKNGEIFDEGGGSCITGGMINSGNGTPVGTPSGGKKKSKKERSSKSSLSRSSQLKALKRRQKLEVIKEDSQPPASVEDISRRTSIADDDEEVEEDLEPSSLADSETVESERMEESVSMMEDSILTADTRDDQDLEPSPPTDEATGTPKVFSEEDILVTYYLVKWKGLPYEDATWELSQDVDPNKVKLFYKWRSPNPDQIPTPRSKDGSIIRPEPSKWMPLKMDEQNYKNDNKLREYQIEGVSWLSFCWHNRQNCILADEMGLGKTVQSITFLLEIYRAGVHGPFLVIVPLSTIGNWIREFENWSDMNAVVYHGSAISRNMIREYEIFYRKRKTAGPSALRHDLYKFHALITTFETLMNDIDFFASIKWAATIIDEAHRLKNKKCKLLEGLGYLSLDHRVLLTGTPLQNNVEELFALLNFLDPMKFNSEFEFLRTYGELKTEDQVNNLKSILRPMMLRRLKDDVEKNLAPKEETIIEVELTNIQKKYYRAIMEKNFDFLAKGCSSSNLPSLLNIMMELRKCCNHPYLIRGAEDNIIKDLRDQDEKMAKLDTEEARQIHALIYASGKLVLIHKLLPKLKANGHKVLIFSQMVRVLDILEDYISHLGYQYERIDGRIHGLARQEAIDRFSSNPDKFVFLLCTKAGGLGINLTAADTVIIYDSDWNPQNDLQAQARCHRIGQSKAVKVYRLITRNTYEREMFDRASLKLGLNKAVLESMGTPSAVSKDSKGPLSKQDVEALLRKGAYGALMDDDKAGEEFCEADIDKILQSRSHVVTIDQTDQSSSFSKASFSISGQRDDIHIDDPEFWQKWAKVAGVQEKIPGHENIMEEPRMRRQVTRYQGDRSDQFTSNGLNGFGRKSPENESSEHSDSSSDNASGSIKGVKSSKSKFKKNKKFFTSLGLSGPLDRAELAKIERGLHTYGWGRWQAIMDSTNFRRQLDVFAVQRIAKAIIAYTLSCTPPPSDVRARMVLEEMTKIGPTERTLDQIATAARKEAIRSQTTPFASDKEDPDLDEYLAMTVEEAEATLGCMNYCIHLQKSGLRFLQKVYTSFYLACDIVGERNGEKLLRGDWDHHDFKELESQIPSLQSLDFELPVAWWDLCCDKCLILGIYKHGWDKYPLIQSDPSLCFSAKLQISSVDQSCDMDTEEQDDNKSLDGKNSEAPSPIPTDDAPIKPSRRGKKSKPGAMTVLGDPFPSASDLNSRIRKLINYYQRMKPQTEFELMRLKRKQRDDSIYQQVALHSGEMREIKWSRREEADFYRIVASYGVEMIRAVRPCLLNDTVPNLGDASQSPSAPEPRKAPVYNWEAFRQLANLGRKSDQALSDYYHAFYRMCQRVCRRIPFEFMLREGIPITYTNAGTSDYGAKEIKMDLITEERATRTLQRIDLLNRVRCDVLSHPQLKMRIELCQKSSELPEWWIPGRHDLELLLGVAKHGLSRTETNILNDQDLSFYRVAQLIHDYLRQDPQVMSSLESSTANLSEESFARQQLSGQPNGTPTNRSAVMNAALEAGRKAANQLMIEDGFEPIYKSVKKEDIEKDEELIEKKENTNVEDTPENEPETKTEVSPCVEDKGNLEDLKKLEPMESADDLEKDLAQPPEWSIKFSSSMALGWPKDRTLQSRLECVVICIETGKWPTEPLPQSLTEYPAENLTRPTEVYKRQADDKITAALAVYAEQEAILAAQQEQLMALLQAAALAQASGSDQVQTATLVEQLMAQMLQLKTMQDAIAAAKNELMSKQMQQSTSSITSAGTFSAASLAKSDSLDRSQAELLATPVKENDKDSQPGTPVGSVKRKRKAAPPQHISSLTGVEETSGDDNFPPRTSSQDSGLHVEGSARASPAMSGPTWDINVPVINMVTGDVIHGEKAPKRKNLEEWLKNYPNYLPYSIEPEDQKIFDRVAKSRGQDASGGASMEQLAYKHYMNSLMSTMSSSSPAQSSNKTASAAANDRAQKEQLEQQQQLLLLTQLAQSASGGNANQNQLLLSVYQTLLQSALTSSSSSSSASSAQQQQQQEQQALLMLMLAAQQQSSSQTSNYQQQQQPSSSSSSTGITRGRGRGRASSKVASSHALHSASPSSTPASNLSSSSSREKNPVGRPSTAQRQQQQQMQAQAFMQALAAAAAGSASNGSPSSSRSYQQSSTSIEEQQALMAAMQYMYSMAAATSGNSITPAPSTPTPSRTVNSSPAQKPPTPSKTPTPSSSASRTSNTSQKQQQQQQPSTSTSEQDQLTAALYANFMQQQLSIAMQPGGADNLTPQEQQQLAAMLQLLASSTMDSSQNQQTSSSTKSSRNAAPTTPSKIAASEDSIIPNALNLSIPSSSAGGKITSNTEGSS